MEDARDAAAEGDASRRQINGITIDETTYLLSQFADDTDLLLANYAEVSAADEILEV